MTTWVSRRWAKSVGVLASALALSLGVSLTPVAPAYAADPPVTADKQDYYKFYKLKSIHDQGITGKGVTIAVLDGAVNPNIPELKGANIQDRTPCVKESAPENAAHGTTVAQILVSPEFGVAPDATLYTYTIPLYGDKSNCTLSGWTGEAENDTPLLIEQAINDGADIIAISSNYPDSRNSSMRWAISRAAVTGVPIVASVGNDSKYNPDDELGMWGGVIGVAALEEDGTVADYSNYGDGVTLAAIGEIRGRSSIDGKRYKTSGTSYASPMVAGFLALAWQRFGDGGVSVRQVLQAMVATAWGTNGQWNERTGYGEINPAALLSADPSQYPVESPLLEKGSRFAFHEDDIYDYYYGLANPREVLNDDWYVYRGVDEASALSEGHGYEVHLGTSPLYHYQG